MKKFLAIRKPQLVVRNLKAHTPFLIRLGVGLVLLLVFMAVLYAVLPTKATYSYGADNCVKKLTVAPALYKSNTDVISLRDEQTIRIAGKSIASLKTCFELNDFAHANSTIKVKKELFGVSLFAQTFMVTPNEYPRLAFKQDSLLAVPVDADIKFTLDTPDKHFEYALLADQKEAACLTEGIGVTCNIDELKLAHATQYTGVIVRRLASQQQNAADITFTTVQPLHISGQSIQNTERVLTKPSTIDITTDVTIKEVKAISLSGNGVTYEPTFAINDKTLQLQLPPDLPRSVKYTLTIPSMRGVGGEQLVEPFITAFYLSPGPSITGMNIGDRAVPLASDIELRFDQPLAQKNYSNQVQLIVNGTVAAADIRQRGQVLIISPKANFARCADIRVEVNGLIQNNYGVDNTVKWQGVSRATCATQFSIGASVDGRGIIGYAFGSGSREILYIGSIHGDEGNTKRLLDKWIYELEGSPQNIPAGTRVVVIPLLNPDGYSRSARYNSRNVDLNRNFAANNWKSDIVVAGGQVLVKGGGESALSEPESSAIASYIRTHRPELVLSYHSRASIAESNEAGNANERAQKYSSLSGYAYKTGSSGGYFNYDTNGSLEEWAKDKLGQPVVLIELKTKNLDEFTKNRTAMWAML